MLWHELVLSGVGGSSIREAKEFLSVSEFGQWAAYYEQHGTMSIIKKLDAGFALLAHLICVGNKITISGKTPSVNDFMYKRPQPVEVCTDINQAFNFLKSVKKNGN